MVNEEDYKRIQYNLVWLFKMLTESHEEEIENELL